MVMIHREAEVVLPQDARGTRFPLRQMEVGQSILVTCQTPVEMRETRNALTSATQYVKRRLGWQYVIRTVDDYSVRCWRTA